MLYFELTLGNLILVFGRHVMDMMAICGTGLLLMGVHISFRPLLKIALVLAALVTPIRFLPILMGFQVTLVFFVIIIYLNSRQGINSLDAIGAGLLGSGAIVLMESISDVLTHFNVINPITYAEKLVYSAPSSLLLLILALLGLHLQKKGTIPVFRISELVYDKGEDYFYFLHIIPISQLFLGLIIITILNTIPQYRALPLWLIRVTPLLLFALILLQSYVVGKKGRDHRFVGLFTFFDLLIFVPAIHGILLYTSEGASSGFAALYIFLIIANTLKPGRIYGLITLCVSMASIFSIRFPEMIMSGEPWDIGMEIVYSLLFVFAYWVIKKFADIENDWQQKLSTQANVDELTGLKNYRYLRAILEKGGTNCLLMFDLDSFKAFNDTFGHVSGDILLREIAVKLRSEFRIEDELIRYGGDEFIVIPQGKPDLEDAILMGKKIQKAVAEAYKKFLEGEESPPGGQVPVTASIGLVWGVKGLNRRALLEAADRALYKSKLEGKNAISLTDGEEFKIMSGCWG